MGSMTCTRGTRMIQDRFGNRRVVPGEYVTLNGEVWFHPYGGQAPMRVS